MYITQKIDIEYLADYPEFIGACASWSYGRWGVQDNDSSLERSINKFQQSAKKEQIPLTLVAVNKETNMPVAMGSLWESDGNQWKSKSPWIASIFTHYRYRNMGIATKIIKGLEKEAENLDHKFVYLKSGTAAPLYIKLGYNSIDTIKTNNTKAGTETLFQKVLI